MAFVTLDIKKLKLNFEYLNALFKKKWNRMVCCIKSIEW